MYKSECLFSDTYKNVNTTEDVKTKTVVTSELPLDSQSAASETVARLSPSASNIQAEKDVTSLPVKSSSKDSLVRDSTTPGKLPTMIQQIKSAMNVGSTSSSQVSSRTMAGVTDAVASIVKDPHAALAELLGRGAAVESSNLPATLNDEREDIFPNQSLPYYTPPQEKEQRQTNVNAKDVYSEYERLPQEQHATNLQPTNVHYEKDEEYFMRTGRLGPGKSSSNGELREDVAFERLYDGTFSTTETDSAGPRGLTAQRRDIPFMPRSALKHGGVSDQQKRPVDDSFSIGAVGSNVRVSEQTSEPNVRDLSVDNYYRSTRDREDSSYKSGSRDREQHYVSPVEKADARLLIAEKNIRWANQSPNLGELVVNADVGDVAGTERIVTHEGQLVAIKTSFRGDNDRRSNPFSGHISEQPDDRAEVDIVFDNESLSMNDTVDERQDAHRWYRREEFSGDAYPRDRQDWSKSSEGQPSKLKLGDLRNSILTRRPVDHLSSDTIPAQRTSPNLENRERRQMLDMPTRRDLEEALSLHDRRGDSRNDEAIDENRERKNRLDANKQVYSQFLASLTEGMASIRSAVEEPEKFENFSVTIPGSTTPLPKRLSSSLHQDSEPSVVPFHEGSTGRIQTRDTLENIVGGDDRYKRHGKTGRTSTRFSARDDCTEDDTQPRYTSSRSGSNPPVIGDDRQQNDLYDPYSLRPILEMEQRYASRINSEEDGMGMSGYRNRLEQPGEQPEDDWRCGDRKWQADGAQLGADIRRDGTLQQAETRKNIRIGSDGRQIIDMFAEDN